MEKNFYHQTTDSDIKRYEEIRKLTMGQGEDYATRCLLIDLNRQKELDADPKVIQKIEFVEQLKYTHGVNADDIQSVFVLTISERNQRNKIKTLSRKG